MEKIFRSAKAVLLVVMFTLTGPVGAHAVDYYIDQKHPEANDANAGTADKPWKTITKANATLIAGDTVHIKNGTYNTYIAPANSGTSLKLITYKSFGKDKVTIADAEYGIYLDGKSYIVVHGLNFEKLDQFIWLQNGANRNSISYCNFENGRTIGWSGSKIYRNSNYNWVHHCRFSKYGKYTTDDIGSVLDIGNELVDTDISNYNVIEHNTMFHGGHQVIGVYGMYNVIRNNYFHNENWLSGYGNRVVYLNGYAKNSGRNLIHGNRIAYSGIPPDQYGGAGMSMASSYNIVRMNEFYHNNLAGISMTTTESYPSAPTFNKIYSNTFLNNGFNSNPDAGPELLAAIGFSKYSGSRSIVQNAIKNNIFLSNRALYGLYSVSLADQIIAGNWEEAGDPLFVNANAKPGDPMNAVVPDFNLKAGSPCIDKGTFLTRITSAPGSGTTLQVEEAGYFMNGWGVVEGDTIQILGTEQKARITQVDYATHTITVETPLTWAQYDGVGLAYEGAAPDIGANEFSIKPKPTTPTLTVK